MTTDGSGRHGTRPRSASLTSWLLAGLIVAVGVAAGIVALRAGDRDETNSAVITLHSTAAVAPMAIRPPPAPSPSETPRSQLLDLTLPTGTTPLDQGAEPGGEVWQVPLRYNDTVTDIRGQLPVTKDLDGLPWCGKNTRVNDFVEWTWGSQDDLIGVTVSNRDKTTEVTIRRGPDPAGC